jgi:Tol biopolymer transport system component
VYRLNLQNIIRSSLTLGFGLSLAGVLVGCNPTSLPIGPTSVNSRYTDEQPSLSANGRFLAFVSNRNGSRNVLLYDLQNRQFADLPGLNRQNAIADSPSISNTARYIVYLTNNQGRSSVVLYDRITRGSQVIYQPYQGWIRNPKISPDGRYIVFESGGRGQWDIEVLDRGPNIELDLVDGIPSGFSLTGPQ